MTKTQACEDVYDEKNRPERQIKTYLLAKARNEAKKLGYLWQFVWDKNGIQFFMKGVGVENWEKHSKNLLNECRDHDMFTQYPLVEGRVGKMTVTEVHQRLQRMKQKNAVGADGIQIESFPVLADFGIHFLVEMLNSCSTNEAIPNKQTQSTITSIYKKEGDNVDCSNLWRI